MGMSDLGVHNGHAYGGASKHENAAEFSKSQSEMLKRMSGMSEVHTKSNRWIGEMLEISSTFESANLSGMFHKAAADTYDFVSKTEIALNETPENYKEDRSLEELIDIFSKYLQE